MYFLPVWMAFLATSSLYGIQSDPDNSKTPPLHKNLLANKRLKNFYIYGLQNSTRTFQEIPHLKKHLKQRRTVRRRQTYRGIPVFGSRIVELYFGDCKRCKVMALGRRASLHKIGTIPLVPFEHSLKIVADEISGEFSKGKLVIYPTKKQNYLTWMIEEQSPVGRLRVFVDAENGDIVDYYDRVNYLEEVEGEGVGLLGNEQSFNIALDDGIFRMVSLSPAVETYRYQGGKIFPGRSITSPSGIFKYPAAIDAHSYSQQFIRFLLERFNRSSFDNLSSPVINTVDYYKLGRSYYNAFWNGKQVVYSRGSEEHKLLPLSGALDIVAHEITHAITERTSGLIYRGESGALNEAFSDIMATYAEHKLDPENADWKIGEDVLTPEVQGDAMRYMNNPTLDGRSSDHYEDRFTGHSNQGGVHLNSGIANLAFYLLVNGGLHPRRPSISVQGIGIERAIDIFYRAFTEFLASSAKFVDARDATVSVAREYDRQTVFSVMQAWTAVGIGHIDYIDEEEMHSEEDGGKTPPGEKEILNSEPHIAIPDNDRNGVKDMISVNRDVRSLTISVDIKHSYRGDLIVKLISPRSQVYTIHRQDGSSLRDLHKTRTVNLVSSDLSVGVWTIRVSDHSRRDTGILQHWSISF